MKKLTTAQINELIENENFEVGNLYDENDNFVAYSYEFEGHKGCYINPANPAQKDYFYWINSDYDYWENTETEMELIRE